MKPDIQIVNSIKTQEGDFQIRRGFPHHFHRYLDPFLLLDYFGPMEVKKGTKPGVSSHPHRGFQTITYIMEGEVEHNDTKGGQGVIKPGGIQWMSAGSGIVHSEFPSNKMSDTGGTLKGIQLWVNLPADQKMSQPWYHDHSIEELPFIEEKDWSLRVIASNKEQFRTPTQPNTPLFIGHLHLKAGTQWDFAVDKGWDAAAFVIDGEITIDQSESASEAQLAVLSNKESYAISAKSDSDIFLLAGQPINEPIVAYGPFVMNSAEEINQAVMDFQSGKF